ncbi:MAG: glucuronylhydrolase [Planctomycetota bacterium]
MRSSMLMMIAPALLVATIPAAAQPVDVDAAFAFAGAQLAATHAVVPAGSYPHYTYAGGAWNIPAYRAWTCGFFPQSLWALYERTGDVAWRTMAEARTGPIAPDRYKTDTHDLGFMLHNSFGYGHRLTGNPTYKSIDLQAAASLATRYNANVGAIKSWDFQEPFPVIIDNMMNLELLFWSAANGGPSSHADIAIQHAITTAREHVRADGSSYHVVDFNPTTGLPAARPGEPDPYRTHQGLHDESTWSRGQAWGLYGFTMTYRYADDPRFLATARLMADWYIDHLPADSVPYWDFDAPASPATPRDSSAAAIAASGLLELAEYVDGADRIRYIDSAEAALASLAGPNYLAAGTNNQAILQHGTYNYNGDVGVDAGLTWGDAYFLEALLRYESLMASLDGGDADRDGDVDLDDFVILKQHFGAAGGWTDGDFDGDGDVDLDDFVILKQHFGAAAIPEPTALALLALGGLARRRR